MEFKLKSVSGLDLAGNVYEPSGKVEKIILLIHGLGEHFGRYDEWSDRFAEKGIAVIGVDLPGHGKSPGRRGHIKSYHEYNSIIDLLAGFAVERFGKLPLGIYGHSLGGNIVLNYLLTNVFSFDFAIVTSPWIILGSEPSGTTMAVARIASKVFPGLLQPNGLKLEDISRTNTVKEKYSSDPLVHDRVSVRLAMEATDAASRILDMGDTIDIPVLLLHGSEDRITSPSGSQQLAELNRNINLKLWDGCYHELHNEPCNKEVFDFIYNWTLKPGA